MLTLTTFVCPVFAFRGFGRGFCFGAAVDRIFGAFASWTFFFADIQ
jgi:hypothetical protein